MKCLIFSTNGYNKLTTVTFWVFMLVKSKTCSHFLNKFKLIIQECDPTACAHAFLMQLLYNCKKQFLQNNFVIVCLFRSHVTAQHLSCAVIHGKILNILDLIIWNHLETLIKIGIHIWLILFVKSNLHLFPIYNIGMICKQTLKLGQTK